MNEMNDASMDALLDTNLDDFADLPEFVIPPAGTYRVSLTIGTKKISDKPAMEISVTIMETMELNKAEDTAPTDGSIASQAFFLDNEYGQGAFKKATKGIAAAVGAVTLRQIMEQCSGMEAVMISKTRKDKNDPDKVYFSIVDLIPV